MELLFVDIETYSGTDLKSCGVHRYVEDPDFDIILIGYAYGDEPVTVVDLTFDEFPPQLRQDLLDKRYTKVAHNAHFERTCLGEYLEEYMKPEQWYDTAVLASECGLPMSLENCGAALELNEDEAKMKVGKELISKFCKPCKATKKNGGRIRNLPEHDPKAWELFIEYNRRDVETERHIYNRLCKWRADFSEDRLWSIDQRINDKGIRVDVELAANAVAIGNAEKAELIEQAKVLTGMANPNSTQQIIAWLEEQEGVKVPSLNKKAVADTVAKLTTAEAKRFMELRAEFSKASTKKYDCILRAVSKDGHIKNTFQFAGAGRTGRWAGRLVQLQNLPQNHMADLDVARQMVKDNAVDDFTVMYPVNATLSELIRTTFIPEDGHRFIVADYSAIEARVIAWYADEEWRLETFRRGGDIYCASAEQMFKVPVKKHGINGELRQKGKIAELALGYGGGTNALKAFGADKSMTEEEMADTVDKWREASPKVVALWGSLEKAAITAIRTKGGAVSTIGHVTFEYEDDVLWMTLASGRRIAYWGAAYTIGDSGRKELTYMGTDQKTKKFARLKTWGGKLTENLVQATARDCLKYSMTNLYRAGFDIRGHVHDEVIITEPIGGRTVEEVCLLMGLTPPWALGLPLRADGYECSSYRKD